MSDHNLDRLTAIPRTSAIIEVSSDGSDNYMYMLLAYDPEQGILRALGEALLEHASCAACGGSLQEIFSECDCGITPGIFPWAEDEVGKVLRVTSDVWEKVIDPLWAKDKRRAYGIAKKERRKHAILRSDAPRHTQADIACLQQAQANLCYYCGASLAQGYHVDHLIALARGGSDGFANIMLACAHCNISKNAMREQHFWSKLQRELSADEFGCRRAAAKEMKKAKWRIYREWSREGGTPGFEINARN